MKKNLFAYITAMLITALAIPVKVAAQRYTVKDLGPAADLVGGVNNKGAVDGTATLLDGSQRAFLWRKGAKTVLGTFGGPNSGAFKGPTEEGQVVGKAETPNPDPFGEDFCGFHTQLICLPFVWQNGVKTPLPTLGGNNGIAFGVNNRGQVAGNAENTTQDPSCPSSSLEAKPVVWQKGEIQELPTFSGDPDGAVLSINDDGQAVGASFDCSVSASHALLWQDGTVTDLGNLGGVNNNFAQNINNQGQIVGFSDLPGDVGFHAFLWTEDKGMQDLGMLTGDVFSGGDGNNDKGQVVGFSCNADFSICRAFLWQNGTMTDLNTLIPASPLSLFEAFSINSRGEITGVAIDQTTDETRAFLAVPENSETDGSTTSGAQGQTSERPEVVLPENVRMMLRHRMGFGRFVSNPQNLALSDTAVTSGPGATLSPTTLTFSTQAVGTTSAAKTVTLKNTGTTALTITGIAIIGTNAGDFSRTTTCGSSLAVGASCSINVTFKPTASGTRTAALSISDNAAGSPQKVTLSGIGTTAKLSPSSLNFGTVAIGSTSSAKTVLTNVGTTSLTISSIAITGTNAGDFSRTTSCGSSLAAGASCTISVSFKPTASGTRSAALSITDNAAGSPQKVTLSGIGTTAKLSPASLTFGSVGLGASLAKAVTLTNVGTTALTITGIAIIGTNAGDFSRTTTCGSSLAVGASCSINVTFKPTASGTRTAALSISDNAGGSPQKVALSGIGVNGGTLTGYCVHGQFLPLLGCQITSDPTQCPTGQPAINPEVVACGSPFQGPFYIDAARSCRVLINGHYFTGNCQYQ